MTARIRRAGALVLACATSVGACKRHDANPGPMRPASTEASALPAEVPAPSPSRPVVSDMPPAPASEEVLSSGIAMGRLRAGGGKVHPGHNDAVRAYATCWTPDGHKVYVTPFLQTFPMNDALAPLAEVLRNVVEGDVWRLRVPRDVLGPGGAAQDMVAVIEIAEIVQAPTPPPGASSPAARRTRAEPSIAFKVLRRGGGGRTPKAGHYAVVDYSAWRPDGDLVETSFWGFGPPWLALTDMAKPWAEALGAMHVGDRVRFWVPGNLESPTGTRSDGSPIVVDMQLLAIVAR